MEKLDMVFAKSAIALSETRSRRSLLRWMGFGGVFLAFSGFAARALFAALKTRQGGGTCTSHNGCGALGYRCDGYAVTPPGAASTCDCRNCLKLDGCPKGTTLALGGWSGCCPCAENPAKGRRIVYQDCCGTALHADCMGCSKGPRIDNGPMFIDCYDRISNHSWCGALGRIFCTQVNPLLPECCLTSAPTMGCNF